MTTDYNPIAKKYKKSKLQPWRERIEKFSFLNLLGEISGKSVVDLACGEGHYTRILKQRGAQQVLGIDLSQGMVDLARAQEAEEPLGVHYQQGDVCHIEPAQPFDLAVSAYLLNYAARYEELLKMCQGVARLLKPGGRYVTVNASPMIDTPRIASLRKYGFELKAADPWINGAPVRWIFYQGTDTFEIENYYLEPGLHEQAFQEAGFRDFRWHAPLLGPAEAAVLSDRDEVHPTDDAADHWDLFFKQPPIILMEAWKK